MAELDRTLNSYLTDISRYPLISADDEVTLSKRISIGDKEALDTLVNSNLRYVVTVAKQYHGAGIPLLDLINEGNVGLIKAAQRFDSDHGYKFITYAVWWIRQAITIAIAEQNGAIKGSVYQVNQERIIRKASAELVDRLDREPTDEELASFMGRKSNAISRIRKRIAPESSFDSFSNLDDNEPFLSEFYACEAPDPSETTEYDQLRNDIQATLSSMPQQESDVLRLHYGLSPHTEPHSCAEIGRRLGLTRERIRQIKIKAIKRLKKHESVNCFV